MSNGVAVRTVTVGTCDTHTQHNAHPRVTWFCWLEKPQLKKLTATRKVP